MEQVNYINEVASRQKARKFIREYYKENGVMPSIDEVNEAKILTPEELEKLAFEAQVEELAETSDKYSPADWDYVWNEETWNDSYENGGLKLYYEWCDNGGTKPYKEDLWNTVQERPANWNDWIKDDQGQPILDENGYIQYKDCVRCWQGALNAPEAKFPWCVVKPPIPFKGTIEFVYDGGEPVYPWGEAVRTFGRGFGVASIPVELGEEFILHDGVTTFEPEKLKVSLIKA